MRTGIRRSMMRVLWRMRGGGYDDEVGMGREDRRRARGWSVIGFTMGTELVILEDHGSQELG